MMRRTREMHPLKILATTAGAALLVWGLFFAYASSPAWAATITVNSRADDANGADGDCTLREAIISANTDTASGSAAGECAKGSGDDVIDIRVEGTVKLTGVLPALSTNIEIEGPGARQFTVRRDTGGDYRIFTVTGDPLGGVTTVVSISGITVTNGFPSGFTDVGGGIANFFGTLTITDSTISGNSAVDAPGGGIVSITTLSGPKTTITNSTISGNTATGAGGGVFNSGGLTVIEFSTITDNTAPDGEGSGVASIVNDSTRTEVLSTIISANTNTDVDFVSGTTNSFVSGGYNLIGDGNATAAFNQTGDQTGVSDPKLGPLGFHRGPTQTIRLLKGSPAINAIPEAQNGCGTEITTDQRGVKRPQRRACDIGALEKKFRRR